MTSVPGYNYTFSSPVLRNCAPINHWQVKEIRALIWLLVCKFVINPQEMELAVMCEVIDLIFLASLGHGVDNLKLICPYRW